MNQNNELICVVDTDPKIAAAISTATEKLCQDLNLAYLHAHSLNELDQYLAKDENNAQRLALLVLSSDCIQHLNPDELKKIQIQYRTNMILTCFEDPLKPLKKTDTWPVENIIYKPFDPAILQEHLHFALVKNEKIKTIAVHSSPEKNEIEKIRRQYFLQLSEIGFSIESAFSYQFNTAYKFYHLSFVDQKKSSQWVKLLSKKNNVYEFVFCSPTQTVITHLREKSAASKNKIKNAHWPGHEKNHAVTDPVICIQMTDPEDFERLKDYFNRKFPKSQIIEFPTTPPKEKLKCDLMICENEFTPEQINFVFKTDPLCFRISNDPFPDRAAAEKILSKETLRLTKPIDRNYLGRMINSFFPGCVESDPNPEYWFHLPDPALHSEMIEVNELSEAAFIYQNDRILPRGEFQEFALTQDDETELKPIKAKIQFADSHPDVENKYLHQVVFFGIRDDMLKKIRLWMLQTHIDHKKSGT